jgi:NAD-dependent dihydropyrimidine dehydrogenase PreA subunit
MLRRMVEIDEAMCDGCGDCIPSCAEGAIELSGGKARLAADPLCDGLGACLGECPRGAIRVVEREAQGFDAAAVARHLSRRASPRHSLSLAAGQRQPAGCPGARPMDLGPRPAPTRLSVMASTPDPVPVPQSGPSMLGQWPVQLHLVSPGAPYFQGADLLVAADCVPFAYARFHDDFLAGRRVVVGCPKLDDNCFYAEKLAEIFRRSDLRSVTVVKMEVPCCAGIAWAVRHALAAAGRGIPLQEVTVGVGGEILRPSA